MDLRLLEYFLESARQESINKAAEVIHISQPTLSRQLAQLEEQLGVQLFVRGNKGIKLTNEGVLFKRRAQEILDLVGKTEDELRSQEQELEGTITIGCGETKAVARLAELIKGFQREHPLVRFDLITGNADASQEGMDRGLIDIGLLLEPVNMSKYEFIRLPDPDPWVVILWCYMQGACARDSAGGHRRV
ncbi:MAG: LysR family transcriptional regulator [Oribacterium sp.]|nr:LysR family transcriptional regulator [Oribacterium sp.]MDY6307128.1 LysR family transcriptional regulator [Oribacterium sp.]